MFLILLAGTLTLILGAGFDWWLYGEPTVSSWNYWAWHYDTLTLSNGGKYSVYEPWWFYIYYSAVQIIPPLTLLLPIFVAVFWLFFPRHPLTWLTIPFIVFHSYFGHKEMRYLFPLLPFAPVMFAMACLKANEKFKLLQRNFFKYLWPVIFWFSIGLNTLLVILTISMPASKEVALWQNCLAPLSSESTPVLMVLDQDGSYSDPAELNMDFYNTNKLKIDAVRDENQIKETMEQYPNKKILYASRKRNRSQELDDVGLSHQLICQALPNWILKININNWTSRTSMWRIWEIKNL
jgi:GPI mannosyltransferase 3